MFTIVHLWRIYIEKKEYLLNPSYYIFYLSNTFKNRVTVSLVCFYAFQNLARILSFGTEHGRLPHRGHTLLLPSLRSMNSTRHNSTCHNSTQTTWLWGWVYCRVAELSNKRVKRNIMRWSSRNPKDTALFYRLTFFVVTPWNSATIIGWKHRHIVLKIQIFITETLALVSREFAKKINRFHNIITKLWKFK